MRGFWGEANVFLQESWELFYWSLWWPSKLKGRIGSLSGFGVLTLRKTFNTRIFRQFIFLILFFSIPLALLIIQQGRLIDWLFLSSMPFIAYGVAWWFFPAGFTVPIISTLVYSQQSILWQEGLDSIPKHLFPTQILFLGIGIGIGPIGFGIISSIIYKILSIEKFSLFIHTKNWYLILNVLRALRTSLGAFAFGLLFGLFCINSLIGSILSIIISSVSVSVFLGLAIPLAASVAFPVSIAIFALTEDIVSESRDGWRDEWRDGFKVAPYLFLMNLAAFIVSFIVSLTTLSLTRLDFPLIIGVFIVISSVSALLHSSVSALLQPKLFMSLIALIMMPAIMIALSFGKSGWSSLYVMLPIALTYYRILPDTLIYSVPSLSFIVPKWLNLDRSLPLFLNTIDNFGGELSWLPIPYHAEILANAFHQNPIAALPEIQRIRSLTLPGYQITTRNLLPLVVSDQIQSPRTAIEAIQITQQNHPFLPILVPQFYEENLDETIAKASGSTEVDLMLPRFQTIATDLSNALNASTIALRERGLDRIIQNLQNLQTNLPAIGLKAPAIKRWTPVIFHWQRLIQLELQEQQKLSQGELLNPFQFGNPLRPNRDNIFQGRRKLADRLYRLILDRDRPTLVLYGTRRAGKTSFLLNLSRFLPSDLIPIYLDLQSSAISNSEADFCYGLTRAIHRDTISQGLKLPAPYNREKFKANPYGTLEDWLDDALPKIDPDRRLLLNLDEFEKIGSAIDRGNLSPRLLDQLRSLIQHYDQLAFMFSGVQTLDELGPNWSSYFISVVPIEMGYLEPNEAEDLLRNPDPDFKMHYADGVIEEILRLTCCQPYLVQLIGSCLVNQANQNQTQLATLDLLEAAIPDAFTNGEPYFTNLWTEFTGTTPAEVTAGQQYLIAITTHNPLPTSPKTNVARRRMIRFHLITEENAIEIPLFERWVRDRAIET